VNCRDVTLNSQPKKFEILATKNFPDLNCLSSLPPPSAALRELRPLSKNSLDNSTFSWD
jgi:hypothetical protein